MGNFYTNYTVATSDVASVAAALQGRNALCTPALEGYVVVYDEASEHQDVDEIRVLTATLSAAVGAPVLGALNHDDDVLLLFLADGGAVVDDYNSSPGYFEDEDARPPEGGDAARLCALFGAESVAEVESILRRWDDFSDEPDVDPPDDVYIFEVERHSALVGALGLPVASVGFGYRYVSRGELPAGVASVLRVP